MRERERERERKRERDCCARQSKRGFKIEKTKKRVSEKMCVSLCAMSVAAYLLEKNEASEARGRSLCREK